MDVSVIISTYNRGSLLEKAIKSVLAQELGSPSFELVVVDNNSTDETKSVVESFAVNDSRVRYVFEERQGLSFGRNAGLAVAEAELVIYTDDDVVVTPNWVGKFHENFLRYPDADFIGGKVLPLWEVQPEPWLDALMSPLALQDMGKEPFKVTLHDQRCLIGACLGVRRATFEKAGLFDTATQRVGDMVGSTEDYDWELKVWEKGGFGMYVPDIVCSAEVSAKRMVKSYHRRWHLGHGKFNAIARRPDYEGGSFRLLDVPAFMYRQFFQACMSYVAALLHSRHREAFRQENLVLFYFGFMRQRWLAHLPRRDARSVPARTA